MTLSIAAPASFWYLRGFSDRIKEMGEILDYIVYMTYDYHVSFSSPHCFQAAPQLHDGTRH